MPSSKAVASTVRSTRRRSKRVACWVGRSWAHLHYARRIEPTWLELNFLRIPIAGLPRALDGLRLVQLSDFHLKRRLDPDHVRASVALANRCEPAVIALTGDFVHQGYRYVDPIAQLLGELRAPLGVFAVLGNHDHAVRNCLGVRRHARLHLAIEQALARHGIRVLRNEAVQLDYRGAPFVVAGIDDLWSRRYDVDKALETVAAHVPRIVLAHNPRTIEHLGPHRCDLMLSGHTHGGQVHLPWMRAPLLGRRKQPFWSGLYQLGSTHLYVNKGVGHSIPFRYRTRPEVALLALTTAQPSRGNASLPAAAVPAARA